MKAKKHNDGIERKCMTCTFAKLLQWGKDPVLAECQHKDPEDRQVANAVTGCPFYLQSPRINHIEHR